jgi:SAM-dependent methyltransferase
MSSDSLGDRLDFSRRADLREWMDEPCSYAEFRDCLLDLEIVNRRVMAYRPTLEWVERLARRLPSNMPLRIVDVGCGGGDMLRQIQKWANAKSISVSLTGIDLNPYAARAAMEFSSSCASIEWVTGDAFSYESDTPIHGVISSLFTHHLADSTLVKFVAWMEGIATRGWFINDLHRGPWAYYSFKALATVMHWHRFVRHDGPISILRSFQPDDWERICAEVGIGLDGITIEKAFPARLCVSRMKDESRIHTRRT